MDIDYGALFGIDEGGKEQGLAAPAGAEAPREETGQPAGTEMNGRSGTSPQEDAGAQGAKEQEAAEPAGEENQDTDAAVQEEPAAGGDEHSETGKEAKRVQDDARNAEFAAARRKAEAERDAAVEKAKADAQEEARKIIDEAFSRSGLMNPYTKKPITSKAEYDEYKQRYDEERKARVMKKSGMSDEEFEAFVNDLPEVRQAKEAQQAAERAQQEANEAQAKVRVDEQLREIGKLNPNIRELKDLAAMETYPRFYELVKKGNTMVDAYRLANFDALTSSAAAATRQAAINSMQGKQHMGQTKERGAGAVSVPADVKEMYRALNPGITDAEIQTHYNRSKRTR
nr:MAG TPA_asm: hypothetical protein [Caudoviricetes sp.]